MNLLRSIEVFLAVAEARSFMVAAGKLGLSRAAVSVQVGNLEAALGGQLLLRHGRSIELTPAGITILRQARPLMELADEIVSGLRGGEGYAGQIRIGVPPVFAARIMAPVVAQFLAVNPGVRISMIHDDGRSNLTASGLDLSIRIVDVLESTSETRLLMGVVRQRIVAAPSYLQQHTAPRVPTDLIRHNCLTPDLGTPTFAWTFTKGGEQTRVHVTGSVKANMAQAVLALAVLGHGIVLQPAFVLDGYVENGRLTPLLPGYEPAPLKVYALYSAPQSQLSSRVRGFMRFLKKSDAFRAALTEPAPTRRPQRRQAET